MIDIESQVFTKVSNALRDENSKIYVTGEYVKQPPRFPHVALLEIDNSMLTSTATTSSNENHAVVMYEVNVFSNKQTGKKSECKSLMKIIDEQMNNLGFVRVMTTPVPNELDSSIYRIYARYRAIVSKDEIIYRG